MPEELMRVNQYRAQLERLGVPVDGRAATLERRDDDVPSIHRIEKMWLLGNRVIGELSCLNMGKDGQNWYRQIIDVNLVNGELNIFAESEKGVGGGASNILTGGNFYPMVDGVRVRQLQQSMSRMCQNLLAGEAVQIEQLAGTSDPSTL